MNWVNIDNEAIDTLCHAYVEQDYERPITWPEVANNLVTGLGVALVLGAFCYFMYKMTRG